MRLKALFTFLLLLCVSTTWAQRTVLLEHFSGASCGPCAAANPALMRLVKANAGKMVMIKYQKNIPGYDPMYLDNTTDVDNRLSYYGVRGVPNSEMDGNVFNDHPANLTQAKIDARQAVATPFTLTVNHQYTQLDSVITTVTVSSNAAVTAALKLHVVVTEAEIVYPTPPGSNGEKVFEHVMKKMLPSNAGTDLTGITAGFSRTYTFRAKINKVYDVSQVEVVAFIQNPTTKEVFQAGKSDPNLPFKLNLNRVDTAAKPGKLLTAAGASQVDMTFNSTLDSTATYRLVIDKKTIPMGWTAELIVDGVSKGDSTEMPATGRLNKNFQLKVTPSGAGKANIAVNAYSSTFFPKYKVATFYNFYRTGENLALTYMDNNYTRYNSWIKNFPRRGSSLILSYADLANLQPSDINKDNAPRLFIFSGSQYGQNMGLSPDWLTAINNYLLSGGRLMVAGQDFAWSFLGLTDNSGTPINPPQEGSDLFENLGVRYLADQSSENRIEAVASDYVLNVVPATRVSGTASSIYSDVLATAGTGVGTLQYKSYPDSLAGIRNMGTGTTPYKTMYFGFLLENLDTTARTQIINRTVDWFDDMITSRDLDKSIGEISGLYPNPSNGATVLSFANLNKDLTLSVIDANGREVYATVVKSGSTSERVETTGLAAGIYMMRLMDGGQTISTKKFILTSNQ